MSRISPLEIYETCRECGDHGSHRVVEHHEPPWFAKVLCNNCGVRIRGMTLKEYTAQTHKAIARDN